MTPASQAPVIVMAFNGPIAGGKSSLVQALGLVLKERGLVSHELSFSGDAAALVAKDLGRKPDTRRTADRELVCAKAWDIMEKDHWYFDNLWFEKLNNLTGNSPAHSRPQFILADSLRLTRTLFFLGSKTKTTHGKLVIPFAYTPFRKNPAVGTLQEFSYINHVPRYDTILKFEVESEEAARWIALREAEDDPGAVVICRHYKLPVLPRLGVASPKKVEKILFASIQHRKAIIYAEDEEDEEQTDGIENSNIQQAKYILHDVATTLKVSPFNFNFDNGNTDQ